MMLENMIRKEVREMPPSGIRKYFDIVNEMEGVISLGVGEPDFVTPWNVREAGIYSLEQGDTHYSSNAGFIELREEIAKYLYRKFDLKYNPKDEILVTVGGSEGIDIALRALTGPGDEVVIPEPSFVAYKGCTAFTGATSKIINLKAENDFKLTAQELEEAITEKTKVVIIPFPNNPTGALTDKEFIEKVLRKSLDTNTIVVIDESFLDFVKDNINYSSKELLNQYNNLIIVKSLTKFFAMPGARIGYGICSNKNIIHKINKVMVPWTVNIMATEGIIQGLKEKDYIENSIEYVNDEKEYLYSALKEISFIKVFEPSVNFIMFKILKNIDLKYELLRKKILIRSCDNYIGLNNSFYRVAVRNREENNELIRQLKNILFDK